MAGPSTPAIGHQPPATSHRPSAISHQPAAMTDEQVLAATKQLAPEPHTAWLAYARTAEGSQVIISTGQKYTYTADALRAAHERARVQLPLPAAPAPPTSGPAVATAPQHVGALNPTPPAPPAGDIIQRATKPVEAPSETHRASEPFSDSAPETPHATLQPNGRRSPSGEKKRPRRQSK